LEGFSSYQTTTILIFEATMLYLYSPPFSSFRLEQIGLHMSEIWPWKGSGEKVGWILIKEKFAIKSQIWVEHQI
jgi:hypothetical protein